MDFLLPVCFKLPKYCIMSTNDDDGMISSTDHNRPMICGSLQAPPQRVLLSEVTPGFLQSGSLVDVHVFSFKELAAVTGNFSCQLGVGGFGPVYMGLIDDGLGPGLKAQPVAVKVLDLERSTQGHREWLAEVVLLGQLKHPNVVNLIGYCCENKDRLLVYEYMEGGNLHTHLFQTLFCSPTTLPWLTRLKIALGAARGLAFLHHQEKPAAAVIYRDFKSSNILLDSENNAKLSDFGLATDGPQDGHTTCVMGTEGYTAPEYIMTGHLTTMSDVFSFGVVLLELLTGRRSVEKSRQGREKVLVDWGMPRLKDPCKLHGIMDPRLEGQYSTIGARKLAALAHKCLSTNPKSRPNMSSVVKALEPLLDHLNDIPIGPFVYVAPSPTQPRKVDMDGGKENKLRKQEPEEEEENCRRRQRNGRRFFRKNRNRLLYSDSELYVIQKTKYHKTSTKND